MRTRPSADPRAPGIYQSFDSVAPPPLQTRDLDIGAGEASVASTRGFEVGSLVKIYDRENADYVVITEVGDKLVKWGTETPVNRRHRAAAPTYLEVMTFEIHVAMRD